jgi:hypothetical protein
MINIEQAALVLLRAMNDLYAHGRTDVRVGPYTAALERANLLEDNYVYVEPAMWWLIEHEALRPDYNENERAASLAGQPDYGMHHYITERGLELLNA